MHPGICLHALAPRDSGGADASSVTPMISTTDNGTQ